MLERGPFWVGSRAEEGQWAAEMDSEQVDSAGELSSKNVNLICFDCGSWLAYKCTSGRWVGTYEGRFFWGQVEKSLLSL